MTVTLTDDEAWHMAMAAAAVLRGRVWPVEACDESGAIAGFRGSLVTHYEWINVQVYDPTSHAFAALVATTTTQIDYGAYARETRRALALWTAIASCPGFSAQANPTFWLRVLREAAPSGQGHVSDVPRFFDTPHAVFPRFRLTFQPRDCYDEDSQDDADAVDWLNTFWGEFFQDMHDKETSQLRQYTDRLASYVVIAFQQPMIPLQVVFRVPMKRTHGPLGSALEQHRGFLRNAHSLTTQLDATGTAGHCSNFRFRFAGSLVVLRGSIHPREYCEIAQQLQSSDMLRVSGLCVDIGNEASLDGLAAALETTRVSTLTINVSKATTESVASLSTLLMASSHISTLRVFNAFSGNDVRDRRSQWKLLGQALSRSRVQELVLERTHLEGDDAEAFRAAYVDHKPACPLLGLTFKPLSTANLAMDAYINVINTIGASLERLDVSALCLTPSSVDVVLQACPRMRSLRMSVCDSIESSALMEQLRRHECQLSALAMSCSAEDARRIIASLANQSPEIALVGRHLKELQLGVETTEPATLDVLVHMLETNESLRFVHVKSRTLNADTPWSDDDRLLAHRQQQLVRKLPLAHTLAFLSVLAHDAITSTAPHGVLLRKFDAGIASEIVAFAGHAVRRQLHCS